MEHTLHPLEAACIDVMRATDACGLKIYLCNPINPEMVRKRLLELCDWMRPECVSLEPNGEETIARNIKLLAACYEQHMIERRREQDGCKPQTS
jgi:hypothetical protein